MMLITGGEAVSIETLLGSYVATVAEFLFGFPYWVDQLDGDT